MVQKTEAEDPSITKDVLNELEETVEKEMKLVDQKKLAKDKVNKIKKDYAVCISTIHQALLDGSASVTSDIRRLVDSFITTLHEARGILVLPRETSDERAPTHGDEEIEEEPAYSDEDEEVEAQLSYSKKRAPTGDPLLHRLLKKPRTKIIDEEDASDLEADSDDDGDTVAHDDEDDEDGFDVGIEDEYRSDDDDNEDLGDELEEDYLE